MPRSRYATGSALVKCPFCKKEENVKVLDSRSASDGFAIRRRRICTKCNRRWTTYEHADNPHIKVVKKNNNREPFESKKIHDGLKKALQKRPVSTQVIEDITERIERRIYDNFESEVPTSAIGEYIMDELKKIDRVAYVRFASVYREFEDVSEFVDAAQESIPDSENEDSG
jgi:transcriptional repressor NrdR